MRNTNWKWHFLTDTCSLNDQNHVDEQTCYHHPPCRRDQVCQLATSTANDCAFEGDEHRKHLQQTEWDLMGHSLLEHESTVPVPVESDEKIKQINYVWASEKEQCTY